MNEMNEKVSFQMGVKFAASVYMDKDFLDVQHLVKGKSTGSEPQSI